MAMALACAAMPAAAAPVAAITNASGRATLLIPLTLTKIDDLDFGTMVSSGTSGTVALNASPAIARSPAGLPPSRARPGIAPLSLVRAARASR